jgi:uncharacterized membrane protein YbhN (UPF0104 family)
VADYAVGALLILVAAVSGGSAGAVATGVVVGATVLVVSMFTKYPLGVVKVLPFTIHSAGDYLAAALLLVAYAMKAFGWRRLFAGHERPSRMALAAAGGAASVTGIALPGRFDDVVRIAVVRRFRGNRVGVAGVGLSLVLLGLIDSAALAPAASVAASVGGSSNIFRAGLAAVAAAGVGAATIVLALPRVARMQRFVRFRVGRWLRDHTTCAGEASKAWVLVSLSWLLRGAALLVLLDASGVGASVPLALAFLCASSASAALPIAPAGAATQAGAGAAILAVSGVPTAEAIAFAVAAQALVIVAGAACVVAAAIWHGVARLAPGLRAA